MFVFYIFKELVSLHGISRDFVIVFNFLSYPKSTNNDKNVPCSTIFNKNQIKESWILKGWFKYTTD